MRAADSMRKIRLLWAALGGGRTGAFNWLMTGMISGSFDPFDSSLGLLVNQLNLAIPAMLLAWFYRPRIWLLFLLCAYVGLNIASNIFGSSEARAWFMLGHSPAWFSCFSRQYWLQDSRCSEPFNTNILRRDCSVFSVSENACLLLVEVRHDI